MIHLVRYISEKIKKAIVDDIWHSFDAMEIYIELKKLVGPSGERGGAGGGPQGLRDDSTHSQQRGGEHPGDESEESRNG